MREPNFRRVFRLHKHFAHVSRITFVRCIRPCTETDRWLAVGVFESSLSSSFRCYFDWYASPPISRAETTTATATIRAVKIATHTLDYFARTPRTTRKLEAHEFRSLAIFSQLPFVCVFIFYSLYFLNFPILSR